ncbi:MAG: hypothetical protein C0399_02935 [Syntrophus sp. (in: bacteria)]|nr:hypothetical protein [Syntrophus sp. (in: bacteria)]
MKTGLRTLRILAIIAMMGTTIVMAGQNQTATGEQYKSYVMDHNYFSCEIPIGWGLMRDEEKDKEYNIYEILLTQASGALIYVSYYAKDNEDFNNYKDFLRRNSKNVAGETQNSREKYGPIKKIQLNGGNGFELERERLIYLSPKSKSDLSEAIKELLYVIPSETGGFYVLHYKAPGAYFEVLLPVFKKVAESFMPQKSAPLGK